MSDQYQYDGGDDAGYDDGGDFGDGGWEPPEHVRGMIDDGINDRLGNTFGPSADDLAAAMQDTLREEGVRARNHKFELLQGEHPILRDNPELLEAVVGKAHERALRVGGQELVDSPEFVDYIRQAIEAAGDDPELSEFLPLDDRISRRVKNRAF